MNILIRLLEFATRFIVGIHNFGLAGAIKVFLLYRSQSLLEPAYIYLKKPNQRFYFRGASDRGVISHFYKAGYRITDEKSVDKISFIIDAGANIGDETTRFRYFHPNATIIAIEPDKKNFQLLEKNTHYHPKTICLNKGLWSKECHLKVTPGMTNESFKVTEIDNASEEDHISAVSISYLIKEFDIPEIDILQMDMEGAERQMFAH